MGAEIPVTMYRAAPRIQSRHARGRYARLRVASMLALLGLFYGLPWLRLDGAPAVWFDLPHRHFHLFGLLLVPQDLIYLTLLLLCAAMTLFFFTTLAGRLWCGYACPQTVWTEAFIWIEHLVEGDRHARLKLDAAPWSARKLLRRGAKHLLWVALALFTGMSFVAYFVPARELFPAAITGALGGWALFWVSFYGFATWGNAGFLREQVCRHMCPYARFQSAMIDRDTLIVAYDTLRGEPRKSTARQRADTRTRGDCVDCSLCVQVCPAGIDIRQGLQYECISCGACVDACNSVMDAVGKPRGLIRHASARQEDGSRFRLWRPRAVAYGLAWVAVCSGLLITLALRTPLTFDVIHDRHSLFRSLANGDIENLYTLKIANQDRRAHVFALEGTLDDGGALRLEPATLTLGPGESRAVHLSVRGGAEAPLQAATFRLSALDEPSLQRTQRASFVSQPSSNGR
jgi:cytochrome c oxidase accessory protein FixG